MLYLHLIFELFTSYCILIDLHPCIPLSRSSAIRQWDIINKCRVRLWQLSDIKWHWKGAQKPSLPRDWDSTPLRRTVQYIAHSFVAFSVWTEATWSSDWFAGLARVQPGPAVSSPALMTRWWMAGLLVHLWHRDKVQVSFDLHCGLSTHMSRVVNSFPYSLSVHFTLPLYIWAKCCMLANQPERMSLFLVTSSSCTGHSSCANAVKF